MKQPTVVYPRTKAGRIHLGALVNDEVKVSEGCNLDDAAGESEILTELPVDVPLEALCKRCFGTDHAAEVEA